jgi:hypothetical protein
VLRPGESCAVDGEVGPEVDAEVDEGRDARE